MRNGFIQICLKDGTHGASGTLVPVLVVEGSKKEDELAIGNHHMFSMKIYLTNLVQVIMLSNECAIHLSVKVS